MGDQISSLSLLKRIKEKVLLPRDFFSLFGHEFISNKAIYQDVDSYEHNGVIQSCESESSSFSIEFLDEATQEVVVFSEYYEAVTMCISGTDWLTVKKGNGARMKILLA
ncbi:MAG: hypothetical protein WCW02_00845 [Candidatus Buchananbacteria bacterium]